MALRTVGLLSRFKSLSSRGRTETADRLFPTRFAPYVAQDLILPDAMRGELAKPLGPVVRGRSLVDAVRRATTLISVGDVVTAELVRAGRTPKVAVVDFRTKRRDSAAAREQPAGVWKTRIAVLNPPGRIASGAWHAINAALKSPDRARIEVEGEEDLLALVATALAPDGAIVVYGQPEQGAVVVHVDDAARSRVEGILSRMLAAKRKPGGP